MIIAICDPAESAVFLPVLRQVDPGLREEKYQTTSNEELVALAPDLLVLSHRMALVQCKALRSVPGGGELRIMVLFARDPSNVVNARIAGADSSLLVPGDPQALFHAFRNESIASRRRREAQALIDENQALEGRYRFKKVLGISLRAAVFLAEDETEHRLVTVKLMRRLVAAQEDVIAELRRKAQRLRGVRSPSMAELLDIGVWQNQPYLVLNIGEAKNLYQVLGERRLPENELAEIGLSITRALLTMKHFKLLHMDIKPENILFYEGKYYLSGFGVLVPSGSPKDNAGFPYWSAVEYASPELFFENAMLTARSDVYSLGMVLYMAAARRNPFAGFQAAHICSKHLAQETVNVAECEPKPSQTFAVAIEAMTLARPSARPRLRDIEIIFYQFLALRNGQYPREPVGQTRISVAGGGDDKKGERADKLISHNRAEGRGQSERRGLPMRPNKLLGAGMTPQAKRGKKQFEGIPKKQFRNIMIACAAVMLGMGAGMYLIYRYAQPVHFHQGPAGVFTCYYEHTCVMRTLDYRNLRCPVCRDWTSPSYTCRNKRCRKVFGLSFWPRRDMTENECRDFEKRLFRCPYCKSSDIAPTPFPAPKTPAVKGKKGGPKAAAKNK